MTVPLRPLINRTRPAQGYDRLTLVVFAAASWALLLLVGLVLTFG